MRLNQNGILLVKLKGKDYDFPKWMEYRINRGRDLNKVQEWLKGLDAFKYAVIYAYNRSTKQRGQQIAFITKYAIN